MRDFVFERKNGKVMIATSGNIAEIVEAIGTVIDSIHTGMLQNDPALAGLFRHLVMQLVSNDKAPMWKGQAISQDGIVATLETRK